VNTITRRGVKRRVIGPYSLFLEAVSHFTINTEQQSTDPRRQDLISTLLVIPGNSFSDYHKQPQNTSSLTVVSSLKQEDCHDHYTRLDNIFCVKASSSTGARTALGVAGSQSAA
jgi:hypothetical protein